MDGFAVGKTLGVNIGILCTGPADLDHLKIGKHVYVMPDYTEASERLAIEKFKRAWETERAAASEQSVQAGYSIWTTAYSEEPLTIYDKKQLDKGTAIIFGVFSVEYIDGLGSHWKHVCEYVTAPPKHNVWHLCSPEFNDHH